MPGCEPGREGGGPMNDAATGSRTARRAEGLLPWLLIGLFALNALNDARVHSAVCDEIGAHIPSGYLYWASGRFSGGVDNFPLGQLLIALPVRLLGLSYELFTEQHLLLFRLPVIAMAVLLGFLVHRFARAIAGPRAGLAALFLFAFCPNMIAHGSLATLDLPLAFFVFATMAALLGFVRKPTGGRFFLFALALAAALATKIQALLLVPLALAVLAAHVRDILPADARNRVALGLSLLWIVVLPWLAINAVYRHMPVVGGEWLPPQFVAAVAAKLHHSQAGHSAYLFGRYSERGWWYYFPVAILLKTPLPALWLIGLGLAGRRTKDVWLFAVLPAAAFLLVAIAGHVNIGLRHVLPIYPFLFVLGGIGATDWWDRSWRGTALALVALLYLVEAVAIGPHHLSYFNVLAGGPRNGHRILIDSNYDWGQNDRFLARYIAAKNVEAKINPDAFQSESGHVFVNVNALYGVLNGGDRAYLWLKTYRPVNRIAYTWFEYFVPARNVPSRPPDERLDAARRLVSGWRTRYADVNDGKYRHALAFALIAVTDYRGALEEIRGLLARDPADAVALTLGGELVVRWKLGALPFRGDEYLSGFRPVVAGAGFAPPDDDVLGRLSQTPAIAQPVSRMLNELGLALWRVRRDREAADAVRRAVLLDPKRYEAGHTLAWMRATSPEPDVRNAAEAVRLAEQVCAAVGPAQPETFDTLAAAYAEAGRFGEAIAAQDKVLKW
ncbi:MAG: hypothetical protein BWK77_06920, partial [Verrucomicrobia bacterium A1]